MPSPKSKGSPKDKGSPKSKGSPTKGVKEKKIEEEEIIFTLPKPEPLPPPPDPPKGPVLSRLRRQVWYPYANRISFGRKEWFWSPFCPVITSWGDIWITDPQQRRILRYYFDPVSSKIALRSPTLITRGEPRMMIEIPRTGRIAVLLTCPTAKKTTLVLYDPIELKEDLKLDFCYEAMEPPIPELPASAGTPPPMETKLETDSTPIGLCANQDMLFVLFQPMQKLQVYDPVRLKPIGTKLENAYPDESNCVHLASSGGCAASKDKLFVAATRPPRIQIFWINRQFLMENIDQVDLVWYAELALDRLAIGEPFGVQLDSLGLLVISDSRAGYMRVYNTNDIHPPGPWRSSLPHAETCYMGSWKVDPYQNIRPGYFSLAKNGTACVVDRWSNTMYFIADRTELRWYDETLLALDDAVFIRPVIDPLMPINGLPQPPTIPAFKAGDFRRSASELSLPPPEDEWMPEIVVKRFQKQEDLPVEEPSPKSSPKKGKKSPDKSPKSKSPPKSGSSKGKKGK